MTEPKKCWCANYHCFHGECNCFINERFCSKHCNCRAKCQNFWDNEQGITEQYAEYKKNKAAAAAAAQAAADAVAHAAAPKPKPLPVPEPGLNVCRCTKSKCETKYCPCIRVYLPCCDQCECEDCDNPCGARGVADKSKAGPGGQGGNSSKAVEPVG